jgi:hypothetical protein
MGDEFGLFEGRGSFANSDLYLHGFWACCHAPLNLAGFGIGPVLRSCCINIKRKRKRECMKENVNVKEGVCLCGGKGVCVEERVSVWKTMCVWETNGCATTTLMGTCR